MIKIFNKYSIYICLSLLLIIIGLITYILIPEEETIESSPIVEVATSIEYYYVDIKGEVINPGVYEVDSNDRIINVIEKAGGLTEDADTSLLNLSKKIEDEMNIKIYSKKEVKVAIESLEEEPTVIEIIKEVEKECVCPSVNDACITEYEEEVEETDKVEELSDLVNINTATKEELMNITGIGESKANSIIEYRTTTIFTSIEDIKNVSGIGDSLFETIKEYITV